MYRVLVVDDEPMILEGFDHLLPWEEYGIEISAKAESGEEAWRLILQGGFDILITDIRMPGMSGLELLRRLRGEGINLKAIILSGYDDFQYVKEASRYGIENYLLKPIEESELSETLVNLTEKLESEQQYQSCVQEGYNLLRRNILYRWVSGSIEEEELALRAEFLNLSISHNYYKVIVIHPFSPVDADRINSLEQSLSRWGTTSCWIFTTVNGAVVLLFFWDSGPDRDLYAMMKQRGPEVRRALCSDVFITIGDTGRNWTGAITSYQEADRLLDYRLIFQKNSVISDRELSCYSVGEHHDKRAELEYFQQLLQSIREQEACEFIRQLFQVNSKEFTPEFVRALIFEVLFYLSASIKYQHSGDLYQELFHTLDLEKIIVTLQNCLQDAVRWREGQKSNPVVESVLRFVEENYDQPLSLKTLAVKYNINAAYLGQLFKQETGEMFSNYLCGLRMKHAKILLRQTQMKSAEIALQVGFSNSNYFSNLFKKMIGMYPTEYRNCKLTS